MARTKEAILTNMIIHLFLLSFFSTVHAAEPAAQPTYLMCKLRKSVRTVRLDKLNSGFEVRYSKEGVDTIVASGKNVDHGFKVMQNIHVNLEKSGWKCRDISSAQIVKETAE